MIDPNARDAQSEVVSDKTRREARMDKREQLIDIMEEAAKGETKATLRARIAELEAKVERLRNMLNGYGKLDAELAIAERRIEALSAAQEEGQQPVAWGEFYGGKIVAVSLHKSHHYTVPLYTRPSEQAVTEAMEADAYMREKTRADSASALLSARIEECAVLKDQIAVKDVVLTKAVQEIERLKNLVGDPEGTTAHAEAFLARAERAEARVAELEKALEAFTNRIPTGIEIEYLRAAIRAL